MSSIFEKFKSSSDKEGKQNSERIKEDILNKARVFVEKEVESRDKEVERLRSLLERSSDELPEDWMLYLPKEEVYQISEETEAYLNRLSIALHQKDDAFVLDVRPTVVEDKESTEDFPFMLVEIIRKEAERHGLSAEIEPVINQFEKDENYFKLSGNIDMALSAVKEKNIIFVVFTHGMENTPRRYVYPFASQQRWSGSSAGVDIMIRTIDLERAYDKDKNLPTAVSNTYGYNFLSPESEVERDVFSVSKEKILRVIKTMEKFDNEVFLKNVSKILELLESDKFVNLYSTKRKKGKSVVLQSLVDASSEDRPVESLYLQGDNINSQIMSKIEDMPVDSVLILDEATELISESDMQRDLSKILKSANKKNIRILFSGLKKADSKKIVNYEIETYRSEKYSVEAE